MIRTLIKNDYILIEPFLLTSPSRGEAGAAAREAGRGRVPGSHCHRAGLGPGPWRGAALGAGGEALGIHAHSQFELLV